MQINKIYTHVANKILINNNIYFKTEVVSRPRQQTRRVS